MHLLPAFLRYILFRRTADSYLRICHLVSFLASVTLSWTPGASPGWTNAQVEREKAESTTLFRCLHPTHSAKMLLSVGLPHTFWQSSTWPNQICHVTTTYFCSFMNIYPVTHASKWRYAKSSKETVSSTDFRRYSYATVIMVQESYFVLTKQRTDS